MEIVESEVLSKVREQFYRLDTQGAGVLSMDGYKKMASIKSGVGSACAKCRWQYAASMTMKEQEVIGKLRLLGARNEQSASSGTAGSHKPGIRRWDSYKGSTLERNLPFTAIASRQKEAAAIDASFMALV